MVQHVRFLVRAVLRERERERVLARYVRVPGIVLGAGDSAEN